MYARCDSGFGQQELSRSLDAPQHTLFIHRQLPCRVQPAVFPSLSNDCIVSYGLSYFCPTPPERSGWTVDTISSVVDGESNVREILALSRVKASP